MKVYIAQLKCPSNHCVIAAVNEYENEQDVKMLALELTGKFKDLIRRRVCHDNCGICGSSNLHVDVKLTAFESVKEAEPFVLEEERKQIATMQFLKAGRN